MKKLTLNILGTYWVEAVTQGLYSIRFITKIINVPSDTMYIYNLTLLGIEIVSLDQKFITVRLPERWTHIRVKNELEVFVDSIGQHRVEINTKVNRVKFFTKIEYGIDTLYKGEDPNNKELVSVTFYISYTTTGQRIHEVPFDFNTYFDTLVKDEIYPDDPVDYMLDEMNRYAENLLEINFPLWRDITAYWDI